jgi:hypothetical protein
VPQFSHRPSGVDPHVRELDAAEPPSALQQYSFHLRQEAAHVLRSSADSDPHAAASFDASAAGVAHETVPYSGHGGERGATHCVLRCRSDEPSLAASSEMLPATCNAIPSQSGARAADVPASAGRSEPDGPEAAWNEPGANAGVQAGKAESSSNSHAGGAPQAQDGLLPGVHDHASEGRNKHEAVFEDARGSVCASSAAWGDDTVEMGGLDSPEPGACRR